MKTKLIEGVVTKISGNKTISVICNYFVVFKKYNKKVLRTRKFLVHDENSDCVIGDKINFRFTKPISKTKNSIFVNKVEK